MKIILTALCFAGLVSCQERQKEQTLEQLDKRSAREVTLRTETRGDSVLHITMQNIWYAGEQVASKSDTIVTAAAPNTWGPVDSAATLSKVPIYVTVQ